MNPRVSKGVASDGRVSHRGSCADRALAPTATVMVDNDLRLRGTQHTSDCRGRAACSEALAH